LIYLFDTNAFSDLMREYPPMESRVAALSEQDSVIICPVVRGEVLYGIVRLPEGKRRTDLMSKANRLFASIPCEAIPETAGDFYANVKNACYNKGLALDENDLWIAATVFASGSVLVTRDGDFQAVDGLTVIDWTA
jgi:predicted nucleic acid-binding protein